MRTSGSSEQHAGQLSNWKPPPPSDNVSTLSRDIQKVNDALEGPIKKREPWKHPSKPKLNAVGKKSTIWSEKPPQYHFKAAEGTLGTPSLPYSKREKECIKLIESLQTICTRPPSITVDAIDAPKIFANVIANHSLNTVEQLKDIGSMLTSKMNQRSIGHSMILDRWNLASQVEQGKSQEFTRSFISKILQQNMIDSLLASVEKLLKFPIQCISPEYIQCLVVLQSRWRGALIRSRDVRAVAFQHRHSNSSHFTNMAGDHQSNNVSNDQDVVLLREKLEAALVNSFEVINLASDKHIGALYQSLGEHFEPYTQLLWRSFAMLRNFVVSVLHQSINSFLLSIAAEIGVVVEPSNTSIQLPVVRTIEAIKQHVPVLSIRETRTIGNFLNFNLDGIVPLETLQAYVSGSLSLRKLRIADFIFEQFEIVEANDTTNTEQPKRILALQSFYKLFGTANKVSDSKIDAIHKKYRDTDATNLKLFQRLFEKYANWTTEVERKQFIAKWMSDVDVHPMESEKHAKVAPRSMRTCSIELIHKLAEFARRTATDSTVASSIETCLSSRDWETISSDGDPSQGTSTFTNTVSYCDWVQLLAEIAASFSDSARFEVTLLEGTGLSYSKWVRYYEAKEEEENNHEVFTDNSPNRNTTGIEPFSSMDMLRFKEAEDEKLEMLKSTLDDSSYQTYIKQLNESMRKIGASLLNLAGVRRTSTGLVTELRKAASIAGNDWKLSYKDFRAVVTRYGIVLTPSEYSMLETHFDHSNSGVISLGPFAAKLFSRTSLRSHRSNSAISKTQVRSGETERRWVKQVVRGLRKESEKTWLPYQSHDHNGRTYWYCPDTMERVWNLPLPLKKQREAYKQTHLRWQNEDNIRQRVFDDLSNAVETAIAASSPWLQKVDKSSTGYDHDALRKQLENMEEPELASRVSKCENRFENPEVAGFTQLRGCCLANLKLERVPACLLPALENLEGLWMDSNCLKSLPPGISSCTQLQHISVTHNKIRKVTEPMALGDLTYLNLAHNELTTIDSSFADLVNLEELHLSHNSLKILPQSIGQLRKLKVITASKNRISNITHPTLQNLTALQKLVLGNNILGAGSLPESLGRLPKLEVLDLQHNTLCSNDLPDSLDQLESLLQLNLAGNRLEYVPKCVLRLVHLEQLNLEHNRIVFATASPNESWTLTKLKILNLSNNKLRRPPPFGNPPLHSPYLVELKLHNNNLVSLPTNLSTLDSLKVLWVHNNKLESLPGEFPRNLEEVKLNYNKLDTVSAGIGILENLRALDLAGNRLSHLPLSIRGLEQLEYLRLEGNPLEPKLARIVKDGYFHSTEELSFSFILKKLVDGLRGADMHGRIDRYFGTSIEEAVAQQQLRNKYYNEEVVLERTGASKPHPRHAVTQQQGGNGMNSSEGESGISNGTAPWSKTWSEQLLEQYFDRFAITPGRIGAKGFRICIQLVGTLLSKEEVDRFCTQTFVLYDKAETGVINYRRVIRAMSGRSGGVPTLSTRTPSITSSQMTQSIPAGSPRVYSATDSKPLQGGTRSTPGSAVNRAQLEGGMHAKYAAVAQAVRRFYLAQYNRKIGASATGVPVGGIEDPNKKSGDKRASPITDLLELKEQRDEKRKANKALRKQLAEARRKAAILNSVKKAQRRRVVIPSTSNNFPSSSDGTQTTSTPGRRGKKIVGETSQPRKRSAKNTNIYVGEEKKLIRACIRKEVKLAEELKKEIQLLAPTLEDYEKFAGEIPGTSDPFYCPVPESRFAHSSNQHASSQKLVAVDGALDKIRGIFNRYGTWISQTELDSQREEDASEVLQDDVESKEVDISDVRDKKQGQVMLSKGTMIPAMGEIFKCFGTGRQGMHPEEWRTKLLHSVKEAFEGEYIDATGNKIAFVSDVQDRMTFKEFATYLKHCHTPIIAKPIPPPVEKKANHEMSLNMRREVNGETAVATAAQLVENENTVYKSSQCYVLVEVLDQRGAVRIEVPSLGCTVKELKDFVQFELGIPADLQVMVVSGRRLVNNDSLRASGLSKGGTVRVVVSKPTTIR